MIVRIWHGRTATADASAYRQFITDTGIPDYRSAKGNLGAQIWQKEEGGITHVWTVSWWDDYSSIRDFAGEDIEKAKYYPDDKKYLLEFEPRVVHYQAYDFGPML